jgi:hypothetical protein
VLEEIAVEDLHHSHDEDGRAFSLEWAHATVANGGPAVVHSTEGVLRRGGGRSGRSRRREEEE